MDVREWVITDRCLGWLLRRCPERMTAEGVAAAAASEWCANTTVVDAVAKVGMCQRRFGNFTRAAQADVPAARAGPLPMRPEPLLVAEPLAASDPRVAEGRHSDSSGGGDGSLLVRCRDGHMKLSVLQKDSALAATAAAAALKEATASCFSELQSVMLAENEASGTSGNVCSAGLWVPRALPSLRGCVDCGRGGGWFPLTKFKVVPSGSSAAPGASASPATWHASGSILAPPSNAHLKLRLFPTETTGSSFVSQWVLKFDRARRTGRGGGTSALEARGFLLTDPRTGPIVSWRAIGGEPAHGPDDDTGDRSDGSMTVVGGGWHFSGPVAVLRGAVSASLQYYCSSSANSTSCAWTAATWESVHTLLPVERVRRVSVVVRTASGAVWGHGGLRGPPPPQQFTLPPHSVRGVGGGGSSTSGAFAAASVELHTPLPSRIGRLFDGAIFANAAWTQGSASSVPGSTAAPRASVGYSLVSKRGHAMLSEYNEVGQGRFECSWSWLWDMARRGFSAADTRHFQHFRCGVVWDMSAGD